MTRNEQQMYYDVSSIAKSLEKIANTLEKSNVTKALELSGERNKLFTAEGILDSVKVITDDYASKHPVDKLQGNDIPLTITNDIPGFEGTLDALDNLTNLDSEIPNGPEETKDYSNKELHELKLHTDEGPQDDDDIHNDYLNDLVQGMNQLEFIQFHSQMEFQFASNDSTSMSDAIYELEYEECLGAIKLANHIKENKQD